MSFNSTYSKQARQFRTSYGLKNSIDNIQVQTDLIAEEYLEFLHAIDHEDRASALKELTDLLYVVWQFAENMGWDLDEAWSRVHASNMSKLGEDGKPIYRVDGKVLKGPNYAPPQLGDLV